MATQQVTFRFQAFLCYSHRDSAWADWLHRALESYPIPPRLVGLATSAGVIPARLAPVFRDRDELPSATDLSAKVSDALAQSACLVVICSPHAAQSPWVNEEVEAFQRLGRANRIFCLIVDGEPGASAWAGREHDECLPAALTHRVDADGRETGERLEPIAADARPGKDGKSNARTKLVAGMLGVDLDDLRHRERRRRRWNVTAAIGAGLALLCLTTALAVNAVIARHAAERRQKQAEDLIGFMLGDLDDKLRQVNRLDILESVGDRVAKYFATLPPADLTDDSLAQRAKALLKIGSVHRDQGRTAQAMEAFNLALVSSEQLVRDAPAVVEYQALHAESLAWLGFVDWSQGRLDQALSRFTAARDILVPLQSHGSDVSSDVLDQLAVARSNVGRIMETRGRVAEARVEYAAVMALYASLSQREPDKLEWKAELGYAHKNLGRMALSDGALTESMREIVADRRIKASLQVLDTGNNERREDLASSNAALGSLLYLMGELDLAENYLRQAVEQSQALLAIDDAGTDWLSEAGRYGWMSAKVARARGDLDEAMRRNNVAIARLDRVLAKDPDNVDWMREWSRAQLESARCLLAQHRADAAARVIDLLGKPVRRLSESDGHENALLLAELDVVAGDVAAVRGNEDAARQSWHAAEVATKARTATSRDPALLDVFVNAASRLGHLDAAADAANALAQSGYRQPDLVAAMQRAGVAYEPNTAVASEVESMLGEEGVAKRE